MKTKENERKLKKMYESLNLLKKANESVKEVNEIMGKDSFIKERMEMASDRISDVAFYILKLSEALLKK